MTRLLWLPEVLRAAGLTVVEHADWRNHDRPGDWSPRFGVVHATAAPRSQSDDVQVRVVRDGRSDLPGPISNAVVDRLGRWHIVSSGRCNSTLTGTAGPFEGWGNTYALSTEACNDNVGEPWPEVQYRSYVWGWAAWCRRLGWAADRLVGHKEHTPGRKTDPSFDMSRFRRDVAALLAGEDEDMPTAKEVVDELLGRTVASPTLGDRTVADWLKGGHLAARDAAPTRAEVAAVAAKIGALGEVIARESSAPDEVRALLAELPAPAGADDIASEVIAGLGGRSAADVARALVAAGQDPTALADELTRLADTPQG